MLPAVTCSVAITPNNSSSTTPPLSLADVRLYNMAGNRLPRNQLTFITSSTDIVMGSSINSAAMCNDGSSSTFCQTLSPSTGDASPSLRVFYPCTAAGATSLSRVLVVNRQDCCQANVQHYKLDFLNAAGVPDMASFDFTDAQLRFSVPAVQQSELQLWVQAILSLSLSRITIMAHCFCEGMASTEKPWCSTAIMTGCHHVASCLLYQQPI
jgi:hypothetical protein